MEKELDMEVLLMRQSSIYSLTLDEIQNMVCELLSLATPSDP